MGNNQISSTLPKRRIGDCGFGFFCSLVLDGIALAQKKNGMQFGGLSEVTISV